MELRAQKTDENINRVKCVVNTCHYYAEGDHCNASAIEIQPRNASSTQETDCATFAPQQGMKG